MARQPAHIVAKIAVKVPYGQDGVWKVIRDLRRFSLTDLYGRVSGDRSTIKGYVLRLALGGFVTAVQDGDPLTWELAIDQPETPRLKKDGTPAKEPGRGQENMWRTMKMLDRFTAAELARHASTDEVPVRENTAATYIRHLQGAGFVMLDAPAARGPKKGKAVYCLDPRMNTGPLAPQIQTTDFVLVTSRGVVEKAPMKDRAGAGRSPPIA